MGRRTGRPRPSLAVAGPPVAGDLRLLYSAVPRLRPRPRSLRQIYFAWMELIALRRALTLGTPDILHDHLGSIRLAGMVRALGSGVPVVLTHPEIALGRPASAVCRGGLPQPHGPRTKRRPSAARTSPSAAGEPLFPFGRGDRTRRTKFGVVRVRAALERRPGGRDRGVPFE
jgi:hypothetical protein